MGLNADRKKYHFINESSCPKCMAPAKNEEHFFLSCATYAAQTSIDGPGEADTTQSSHCYKSVENKRK